MQVTTIVDHLGSGVGDAYSECVYQIAVVRIVADTAGILAQRWLPLCTPPEGNLCRGARGLLMQVAVKFSTRRRAS